MDKLEENKIEQVFPVAFELEKVEQQDKSSKKVFVHSVYSSAVQCSSADFNPKI